MARRPNYRQERSERVRNKEARRVEKQNKRDAQAASRKSPKTDPDAGHLEPAPDSTGADHNEDADDVAKSETEERE